MNKKIFSYDPSRENPIIKNNSVKSGIGYEKYSMPEYLMTEKLQKKKIKKRTKYREWN